MEQITRQTTIQQALEISPRTAEVFLKYGMHCIGCQVATWETVEETAFTHGIEDIDTLVNELNQAVQAGS
ncbi:DUF1858 domain-containing protein [bacterium]|nr:DUF1858 domain-containing protein [bacterium]